MEDRDILLLIRAALTRGDVEVILDVKRQHHVDSPLYRESDSSPFIFISMAVIAALAWFFSWQIALGAFVAAAVVYMLGVRRFVAVRMRRRLTDQALADPEMFRKAWKLPGITLRHTASGTSCESPDGLWRSFGLDRCR